MNIVPYLIRPDKTTATVDLSKESALEADATKVECIRLEAEQIPFGWDSNPVLEDYPNQGRFIQDIRQTYHAYSLKNVFIGNWATNEAKNRKRALEYAAVEWTHHTGKVSLLAAYDEDTGIWEDVFKIFKSSTFIHVKTFMKRGQFLLEPNGNITLTQLTIQEVWS